VLVRLGRCFRCVARDGWQAWQIFGPMGDIVLILASGVALPITEIKKKDDKIQEYTLTRHRLDVIIHIERS